MQISLKGNTCKCVFEWNIEKSQSLTPSYARPCILLSFIHFFIILHTCVFTMYHLYMWMTQFRYAFIYTFQQCRAQYHHRTYYKTNCIVCIYLSAKRMSVFNSMVYLSDHTTADRRRNRWTDTENVMQSSINRFFYNKRFFVFFSFLTFYYQWFNQNIDFLCSIWTFNFCIAYIHFTYIHYT